MSQPIELIKQLLNLDEKLLGQVINIQDNELLIATSKGLVNVPIEAGITIGDEVTVFQGKALKRSTNIVNTYFL